MAGVAPVSNVDEAPIIEDHSGRGIEQFLDPFSILQVNLSVPAVGGTFYLLSQGLLGKVSETLFVESICF